MNHTENYQLTQWEKSDRIMMDDFNDNNAKLDAALARLDELSRNLAYYIGQVGVRDKAKNGAVRLGQRCMVCECLNSASGLTLSSGLTVKDGALVMNSGVTKGTVTGGNIAISYPEWTQARIWVHHTFSKISVRVNGELMTSFRGDSSYSGTGVHTIEHEFVLDRELPGGQLPGYAQVTIELERNSDSLDCKLYDYALYLF